MKKVYTFVQFIFISMLITGCSNNNETLSSYEYWDNLTEKFTPVGYVGDWESVAMVFVVPIIMLISRKWKWFLLFLILDLFYAYFVLDYLANGVKPQRMLIFWGIITLLYLISLINLIIWWYKKRTAKR